MPGMATNAPTTSASPSWPRILLLAAAFWTGLGLVIATLSYAQDTPDGELTWRPLISLMPIANFLPYIPATLWLWSVGKDIAHEGLRRHRRRATGILLTLALLVTAWQVWLWGFQSGVMLFGSTFLAALQLLGTLAACTAYHAAVLAHQQRSQLLDAQLRNLRGQLQPHALFNTLQAIGSTAEQDGPTAARMITLLGDMLRHSLAHKDSALVPLGDELALLDPYLQLQHLRFADRLRIDIDVPAAVRSALVPDLLLQPLVENALLHGIERRPGAGSIQLRAHRDGEFLQIEVADDGLPSAPATDGFGTGLGNTAARLQTMFGDRATLQLQQNGRGGTTARLRLPFREVPHAA
jgi:glucose-6-phosphate-specific signal transduction histidine kinase